MARVPSGEQAEGGEHGRQRTEAGDPERRHLGHARERDVANDDPREKRADKQNDGPAPSGMKYARMPGRNIEGTTLFYRSLELLSPEPFREP